MRLYVISQLHLTWSSFTLCSKTGFYFSFQLMSFLVFFVNTKFFKVLPLVMITGRSLCYEFIVHNKKIHRCRVKSQNTTLWNKEHMSERKKFLETIWYGPFYKIIYMYFYLTFSLIHNSLQIHLWNLTTHHSREKDHKALLTTQCGLW